MANTLNLGNGNWAAKEGSLLAYNDENGNFKPLPFDFTRASSATRVNSQGLIEVVGSEQPRVDYSSGEGALLLEPASTNVIEYSNDFTQSSWVKLAVGVGTTPVITADYAISPDGTQNASRLVCNLNGGTTTGDQSIIYDLDATNTTKTISIYMKSNTGSNQTLYFSNTFTGDSTDEALVTTEWKRFTFSHTTSNHTFSLGLRGGTGSDDTADVLIYAAQAEAGSYATSYIPTQGAAVTRVADDAVNTLTNQIIDSTKVVFYNEFNIPQVRTSRITLSDNSYNNGVLIETRTENKINGYIKVAGVVLGIVSSSTLNLLSFNKVAIKFDGTSCYLYVNGIFAGSALTGSTFSVNTLNTLRYDRGDGSSSAKFYGNIKETKIYNTALTDAELIALTTI